MRHTLRLETLETRETPASLQLFALSQDGNDDVIVHAAAGPIGPAGNPTSFAGSGRFLAKINPYGNSNIGVRVAVGDVTGDNIEDVVTVNGPGATTIIKVFDGSSLLNGQVNPVREIRPFNPAFQGGAYVAIGQIDINTFAREIVVGAGDYGPSLVKIYGANNGVAIDEFLAFGNFAVGARVASDDFNGDGRDDVAVASGPGGGPHVRMFDRNNNKLVIDEFFAYDPGMLSGVYIAAGELDGVPNRADLATGPSAGASPHARVWCAAPGQRYFVKAEAFVSDPQNTFGVRVGVGNLDLRTGKQSLYVGDGPGVPYNLIPPSTNSEVRLRPFSIDDFIFGVPVPPGSILAQSFFVPERISIFDGFGTQRAGGLYIGV